MTSRIGLVGCGAIGSKVARFIVDELSEHTSLRAICDTHLDKTEALKQLLSLDSLQVYSDYQDLLDNVDFVIETASVELASHLAKKTLQQGKDVMIVSVGGLVDQFEWFQNSASLKGHLYIPTGAISGLDALSSGQMAGLESVSLLTRKPPKALMGEPYLEEKGISLDNLEGPLTVFEGTSREAIRAFPKNINVSVLLSLASLGPDQTRVRIETSPTYTTNSHEVSVKGDFGTLTSLTENVPDPDNPKTSYLATLSVCAMLKKLFSRVKIG
jgi:aspartate dehydrogenase